MITISVANLKGGVAKTTTAQALFHGLVAKGYKVLAVDLDPQSNLSLALGAIADDSVNTIYEVMDGTCKIDDAIQNIQGGYLIPSNILLSGAEREFINKLKREELLSVQFKKLGSKYDFVIIDTQPSLGILTVNAFVCTDKIIIPMTVEGFSLQGILQLNDTVDTIKEHYAGLSIEGVLLTKFNGRTLLTQELIEVIYEIAEEINTKVFDTRIRSSVSIPEAQTQKANILEYAQTNAQIDYKLFINELLEGLNK